MIKSIDQTFVDNLPPPKGGKPKVEYRAKNFPKGFFIETRATSKGIGTFRFRHNGKDTKIGRSNEMTLEEALEAVKRITLDTTTTPSDSNMTLSVFYEEHFKPYAQCRLRTFRTYEGIYRKRLKPRFGNRLMDSLTVYELEQFQTELLNEGLSESHTVGHIKLIMRMLNLAVKWKFLSINPCEGVEMIKFDNRKERYLTKEEQHRLVEAASKEKNRQAGLLIVFLLSTGMRCGAARELRWEWVSIEERRLIIPAAASKNKQHNTVYLNDSALWVLGRVKRLSDNPYVFVNPNTKKPMVNISKPFKRALAAAELPRTVRVHDLRHTFCHNLVSDNHSLAVVKELVNHANYETTLRYAKIAPVTLREALRSGETDLTTLSGFK